MISEIRLSPTQLDITLQKLNESAGDISSMPADDLQDFEARLLQINSPEDKVKNPMVAHTVQSSAGNSFINQIEDNTEIGESQLMELCSGAFITQNPNASQVIIDTKVHHFRTINLHFRLKFKVTELNGEESVAEQIDAIQVGATILSSDEDEEEVEKAKTKTKRKMSKNKKLVYSGTQIERSFLIDALSIFWY